MSPRLRDRVVALLVVVLAASAFAGDRDRLIVREALVQPSRSGSCRMELYVSAEPGYFPYRDSAEISIGGVAILGNAVTRSPRNGSVWDAQRWRLRSRERGRNVAVDLDLNRGIVRVRARGVDFSSLAAHGPADVPVVVALGPGSASASVTFRETKSTWRFTSARDAAVPVGPGTPYRELGGWLGVGSVAGQGVARSSRELRAMLPDVRILPSVDFAQEVVVAVGLARGVEACHIPTYQITGVTSADDGVVVDISVQYPTPTVCTAAYVFYDVSVCIAVPRVSGRVSMRLQLAR